MSTNLSKAEEAALHELGENIAIYADQMQELAAEEHQSAGTTLYLSSGKRRILHGSRSRRRSSDRRLLLVKRSDLQNGRSYAGRDLFKTDRICARISSID